MTDQLTRALDAGDAMSLVRDPSSTHDTHTHLAHTYSHLVIAVLVACVALRCLRSVYTGSIFMHSYSCTAVLAQLFLSCYAISLRAFDVVCVYTGPVPQALQSSPHRQLNITASRHTCG